MTPHSPQTHTHLLLPILLLVVSFSTTSSVGISGGEAGSDSPLNTYFNKDNEGLTIFDYAALGKTPDEKPSLLKIETSESEAADPSGKSTLQAILEKVMSRQEATQEYFTGRKVMNDCQTFPYCNHIPAPPAVLPPPNDLDAPNPNIWYPWLPRIKSQAQADQANQDLRGLYYNRDIVSFFILFTTSSLLFFLMCRLFFFITVALIIYIYIMRETTCVADLYGRNILVFPPFSTTFSTTTKQVIKN